MRNDGSYLTFYDSLSFYRLQNVNATANSTGIQTIALMLHIFFTSHQKKTDHNQKHTQSIAWRLFIYLEDVFIILYRHN